MRKMQLSNFEIEKIIGKGSLGKVYKVREKTRGINYALKIIGIDKYSKNDLLEVEKEIEFFHKMKYYSTQLYYTFKDDEYYYFIFELCDGTLLSEINKKKGFSIPEIVKVLNQLNYILNQLVVEDVIIKNLKLENILIKYTNKEKTNYKIKLSDYGLGKRISEENKNIFISYDNPITTAPEVHLEKKYNMKSDLWSIGILIYYMFYNEYPFIERFYFDIIKNEIQLEKLPLDDDLKFLLENLIKKDINKRLSWEEYFSNPLFQNNYFTCEYKISKDDLKEPIQIINCFDKEKKDYVNVDSKFNDKEILEHCELFINNKKIDFCFKFKFPEEGNYTIKIVCEQPLSNTSFLFYNCKNLISIDLSNFNTNFVEDMKFMFGNCISLTELDLSNFNTKNVINMGRMFINCSSLNYLDITKFNTKKVKYMYSMFSGCCSLTDINLESFKTDNVIDMHYMFFNCRKLINLDLNHFNTINVKNMKFMFSHCIDLEELKIDNFNTENTKYLDKIFYELKKCHIITHDRKLLNIINKIYLIS